MQKKNNAVLVLSSLDPQGSAGMAADILSINNARSSALPIITNLTVQNTSKVFDITPVKSEIIIKQFDAIYQDTHIDSIKIGLITSTNLDAIQYIIKKIPDVRIVLDPILKASTQDNFNNLTTLKTLLPNVFLLTPNAFELETLTSEKNQQKAVEKLNIPWVLLTQTDNSETIIIHKLFHNNTLVKEFEFKKLDGNYHGSGCVLSSAIVAKITQTSVLDACELGLHYTYQSLLNPLKIGKMQFSPNHHQNEFYK